jgi:hypothetical protein
VLAKVSKLCGVRSIFPLPELGTCDFSANCLSPTARIEEIRYEKGRIDTIEGKQNREKICIIALLNLKESMRDQSYPKPRFMSGMGWDRWMSLTFERGELTMVCT